MENKLNWITLPSTKPGTHTHILTYMNEDYLIPEEVVVGEVRLRHIYEELEPEFHTWVTNPSSNTQKKWTGSFKSLQEAKDHVQCVVTKLILENK